MTNTQEIQPSVSPVNGPAVISKPRRRRIIAALVAVAAAAAIATTYAVVTADTPIVDSGLAGVAVGSVPGVGELLVDGEGRALYIFEPDEAANVTCTGGCASKWPPLESAGTADPQIGSGIDTTRVSTVADQDGAQVLTFDGWPLYRYTSDGLGQETGSGKDQNGGTWWALTPAGDRIEP